MFRTNVSWVGFERALQKRGRRRFRLTYHHGNLEMTTNALGHQHLARCLGRLAFMVAYEMTIPVCSGGSTTLKHFEKKVAIEPDDCFWIAHEAHMRGKHQWNALDDPPPDLTIEIPISAASMDRLEVYAALKVPEVWRFDGESLKVLVLGTGSKYKERSKSVAFPSLPMDEFVLFIKKLGSVDEIPLSKEFTAWLRSSVVTKKPGGERKNGRR